MGVLGRRYAVVPLDVPSASHGCEHEGTLRNSERRWRWILEAHSSRSLSATCRIGG